jgi:hypothetical protein
VKVWVFESTVDPSEPFEVGGIAGSLAKVDEWVDAAMNEVIEADGYVRVERDPDGGGCVFANYGNGEFVETRWTEREVEK